MKRAPQTWIQDIKNDRSSGAAELASHAGRRLADWAQQWPGDSIESLKEEAFHVSRELVEAQPVMVPLRQLANRVLSALDGIDETGRGRETICRAAHELQTALDQSRRAISRRAAELVEDGKTLLTHSYSSTLLAALVRMTERGKRFEVFCTESRPRSEGLRLAEKLAEAGVRVTVIADSAAFQLLSRVDLILVGGDALTPGGLINKIGTRALALSAYGRRPFFVLCGTEKFWPQPLAVRLEEQMREPEEVWAQAPAGVRVWNFYFDQTPLDHLTGVVTQDGVLSPSEVLGALKRMVIHPRLRDGPDTA